MLRPVFFTRLATLFYWGNVCLILFFPSDFLYYTQKIFSVSVALFGERQPYFYGKNKLRAISTQNPQKVFPPPEIYRPCFSVVLRQIGCSPFKYSKNFIYKPLFKRARPALCLSLIFCFAGRHFIVRMFYYAVARLAQKGIKINIPRRSRGFFSIRA